jgi:hypothetical protein
MNINDKNRTTSYPTVNQFHSILKLISSDSKFTKSAVEALRKIYLSYMQQVASSLTQWDSLKEKEKFVEALGVNPTFKEYVNKAKLMLCESSVHKTPPKKKRRIKRKLTAEDAAEQERLLAQSKEKSEAKVNTNAKPALFILKANSL